MPRQNIALTKMVCPLTVLSHIDAINTMTMSIDFNLIYAKLKIDKLVKLKDSHVKLDESINNDLLEIWH